MKDLEVKLTIAEIAKAEGVSLDFYINRMFQQDEAKYNYCWVLQRSVDRELSDDKSKHVNVISDGEPRYLEDKAGRLIPPIFRLGESGVDRSCPYPPGSAQHDEWMYGIYKGYNIDLAFHKGEANESDDANARE